LPFVWEQLDEDEARTGIKDKPTSIWSRSVRRHAMTGLWICAVVVAFAGANTCSSSGVNLERGRHGVARVKAFAGLALIAVALWLAYAAGGA